MRKIGVHYLVVTLASLVAPLLSTGVQAAAGDLYEADFGTGSIFKFKPDGTKTTFATGLGGPRGLAFDGLGNLFEAENAGQIFKIAPDGTKTMFVTGLSTPFALAFDTSGNLFAADFDNGRVVEFAPDGTQTVFAPGLNFPRALAFDQMGNLFVGEATLISKFTPDGTKTIFASGLNNVVGLAFDSSGNLFETDASSGNIFKFTPDGTKTTFASGLLDPFGLALDNSGNLFVSSASKFIFVFTPTGMKTTFATGLSGSAYLAFQPTLHALFNISTRGFVGTGDAVLIGGFIVTGNGMVNSKVLIRAAGPSLTAQGVSGALQDTVLRLFNSSGAVIASNDNWKDTQQTAIQATGLAPSDDRESAILASLASGAYTAIVTGAGNTTGIARVDVFNVQ